MNRKLFQNPTVAIQAFRYTHLLRHIFAAETALEAGAFFPEDYPHYDAFLKESDELFDNNDILKEFEEMYQIKYSDLSEEEKHLFKVLRISLTENAVKNGIDDETLSFMDAILFPEYYSFKDDPYLECVKLKREVSIGDFTLGSVKWLKDTATLIPCADNFPPVKGNTIGKIRRERYAVIKEDFESIALTEKGKIWMSISPAEIETMKDSIKEVHGKVLVMGLGIAYYPFMAALKEDVSSVTVVELNEQVIKLVTENIFPLFPENVRNKIKVIHGDAIEYARTCKDSTYDYCFADIWKGNSDGMALYMQLVSAFSVNASFKHTAISYWVEDQIIQRVLINFMILSQYGITDGIDLYTTINVGGAEIDVLTIKAFVDKQFKKFTIESLQQYYDFLSTKRLKYEFKRFLANRARKGTSKSTA